MPIPILSLDLAAKLLPSESQKWPCQWARVFKHLEEENESLPFSAIQLFEHLHC